MQFARLTRDQLKKTLDYLYDGCPDTIIILLQLRNYKREHQLYLWLVKNKIRGTALLEFFQNESGDQDGGGFLSGVTMILNSIDKKKPGTPLKGYELV